MRAVLAFLLLAFEAVIPVSAQPMCPVPLQQAIDEAQATGGVLVNLIEASEPAYDQVLVVEIDGMLRFALVSHGCVVAFGVLGKAPVRV